jgi:hypothetical protein
MGDSKNPSRSPGPTKEADRLMVRIDRALARWPLAEADGATSEAKAAAITARATSDGEPEATDGDVLAPPLPALPDEGPAAKPARKRATTWIVAAAAVAAVAAGFVGLGIRGSGADRAFSAGAPASPSAASGPPATAGLPGASPSSLDVPGVDPASLPLAANARGEKTAPSTPLAPSRRSAPAAHPGTVAAGASPAGSAPGGADPFPVDDSLRPAAAIAPGSNLAVDPSSVPRRPSLGAVQAAFGAVLPAARACLDANDPPYRATVTFQSDGSVRSVALSEPDSSKTACVKAALAGASVPGFALGSYGAPVTVRALGH